VRQGRLESAATDAAVRTELARRLSRRAPCDPASLRDDLPLADLGLGSLDLLELVDALEDVLGAAPFEGQRALTDVRTVGDLCAAYRPAASTGPDDLLEDSRRRAEARRRGRQP
jgi:acyl carrier protein